MLETLNKIVEGKKNLEGKTSEPRNDQRLQNSLPFHNEKIEAIYLNC